LLIRKLFLFNRVLNPAMPDDRRLASLRGLFTQGEGRNALLVSTRRTQRVAARFQVQVRKQADGDAFITEVSHTLVVNPHGALIHLALKVQLNDILLIKHLITWEERRSRVVWVGRDSSHLNEVAVEFTVPAPHFWHIDFPPADWKREND
jgi:hypothetical protein